MDCIQAALKERSRRRASRPNNSKIYALFGVGMHKLLSCAAPQHSLPGHKGPFQLFELTPGHRKTFPFTPNYLSLCTDLASAREQWSPGKTSTSGARGCLLASAQVALCAARGQLVRLITGAIVPLAAHSPVTHARLLKWGKKVISGRNRERHPGQKMLPHCSLCFAC